MTWLIDTTLQNAPRFFGRRAYFRLAAAFCTLFALVLLAVWRQHATAPGTLESATPAVQLDAAPAPGEAAEPPFPEAPSR